MSQTAVVLRLTNDTAMRHWVFAALVFFGYVLVLAPLVPGLRRAARWRASLAALAGFDAQPPRLRFRRLRTVLRQWVMPPALLLVGYWASGQLFAAPMPGIERALCSFDRNLGSTGQSSARLSWLRAVLELAYAGVYVLVPVALLIRFATVAEPNPDGFWTIILVTDFVCFACLPWIQTRPPRALSGQPPWQSGLRRLNEQVLARTSIQHNTFPSGHAAEAVACALLVAAAPWPVLVAVAVAAALVSAGAVLGRYHYAADAVVGLGRRAGCLGGAEVIRRRTNGVASAACQFASGGATRRRANDDRRAPQCRRFGWIRDTSLASFMRATGNWKNTRAVRGTEVRNI